MNVLVTGATGFLGCNLVHQLVRRGDRVRALKRPGTPQTMIEGFGVEIVSGDVTDRDSLLKAMRGIEGVYHVAGMISYWRRLWHRLYEVNVEGTRNVIDAALRSRVRRVVYTSSIGALAVSKGSRPSQTDCKSGEVYYWKTKYWGREIALRSIHEGLEVVVTSPGWIFGPRDVYWNGGRLFRLVASHSFIPLPQGSTTTCDVDDVCVGHIAAMERGRPGTDYVLGGTVVTFRDLVGEIARVMRRRVRVQTIPYRLAQFIGWGAYAMSLLTGREPPLTPEIVRMLALRRAYSSELAISDLGYPQTPLRYSLERTYHWYRDQGLLH